ncbi:MAG: hypothetical protein JWL66_885 [Sphingomonadales bacterium]|nr:hypothetical protein [Sphingomonadales bacterium]
MIYPHPESLKQSRSGRVSTSTWPHVPLPRERVRASTICRRSGSLHQKSLNWRVAHPCWPHPPGYFFSSAASRILQAATAGFLAIASSVPNRALSALPLSPVRYFAEVNFTGGPVRLPQ